MDSGSFPTKELVGKAAVNMISDLFLERLQASSAENPFIFGLGTGSTVAAFWPILQVFLSKVNVEHIVIIPTSYQSREILYTSSNRYPVVELNQYPKIDCLVDGFDEGVLISGAMIKGGGGAHVLEKLAAESAIYTIYLGTSDKISPTLGAREIPIPVEVIYPAVPLVQRELAKLGSIVGKMRHCGGGKVGPVITDSGNQIIDLYIHSDDPLLGDLEQLNRKLQSISGVIGCGLFVGLASCIIVADSEGKIRSQLYRRK